MTYPQSPGLHLYLGKSGSGKTHFIIGLLHDLQKIEKRFDVGLILSGSLSVDDEWSVAAQQLTGKDKPIKSIEAVDEEQIALVLENYLRKVEKLREKKPNAQALLVLDDLLGIARFGSPIWSKIAGSGRHWGVCALFTSQHYFKLPPTIRENAASMTFFKSPNGRACGELVNVDLGFDYPHALKTYFDDLLGKQRYSAVRVDLNTADQKKIFRHQLCIQS